MIPAPHPHDQAAPVPCESLALRESLSRPLAGSRFLGAGQAGEAIVGVTEATGEIAGANGAAMVSLALIPPRTLAPALAAASPPAARAGARAGSRQETGYTDVQ